MIVIEAVRTDCWRALTGQRDVVTVQECADELTRGESGASGEYVPVADDQIARMRVETLTNLDRAQLALAYDGADGLDDGERDLLAHALSRKGPFELCSADKAAVRAANALGIIDRVVSFESALNLCGGRPLSPLRSQFTERRLGEWKTAILLGRAI